MTAGQVPLSAADRAAISQIRAQEKAMRCN